MPTNIFFNSSTRTGSDKDFLHDFGVSKNPSTGVAFAVGNTQPQYMVKGSGTPITIADTQFAYQFSGNGDKDTTTRSDSFVSNSEFGFPTRTYSSQILTNIKDRGVGAAAPAFDKDDIQNGNLLPIFIFGSTSGTNSFFDANKPSVTFKKIRIIVELFNLKNGVDYSAITSNLFNIRVFTGGSDQTLTNFLQTITPVNKVATHATYVGGLVLAVNQFQFSATPTGIGITPTSIGTPTATTKYVINYELDLDKTINPPDDTFLMVALQFNGSGAAGGTAPNLTPTEAGNFDEVNLKLTSHVTIYDNTKSPSRDNL